jgi:hypothetical protein
VYKTKYFFILFGIPDPPLSFKEPPGTLSYKSDIIIIRSGIFLKRGINLNIVLWLNESETNKNL